MTIETERLVLRSWRDSDAEALYQYARDERVGPAAGWCAHRSVEESLTIIRRIFQRDGVFAVTLKPGEANSFATTPGEANSFAVIGCIGLITGSGCNHPFGDNEGEISYWLGVPFWGQGLIPEAVERVVDYGFNILSLDAIWCGYFDGNRQSERVAWKCGFEYHHTVENSLNEATGTILPEHLTRLTADAWRHSDSRCLATERLRIRQLSTSDHSALYSFMSRPEVMYAWEHGFSEYEVTEWIKRQQQRYFDDGIGYWGVELIGSGELIGQAGLLASEIDGNSVVELGYIFDNRHWHCGYAHEAARCCIKYALNTLHLDEIYCTIRPENTASVRLAKRLGMTPCGSYIKVYRGKPMPHSIYKLAKSVETSE